MLGVMRNIDRLKTKLNNKRLFLTGGTGFFGKSFLEFFKRENFKINLTVLSRNHAEFISNNPELAQDVEFIAGDITNLSEVNMTFDYVIHAATTVAGAGESIRASSILNDIISGTQNILQFADKSQVQRLLNISSGAVYGIQPSDIEFINEDYQGAPDTSNPLSAYGEGKRVAELLCAISKQNTGLEYINARCFAFIGRYLPLDSHLAIGNFINNGLKGENLIIKGDGSPLRSYMYSDDLVTWLLTILLFGESGESYNVGSDKAYSLREVADCVCRIFPGSNVKVENDTVKGLSASRYIPSVNKCRNQLGLEIEFDLNDSIKKTVEQYK